MTILVMEEVPLPEFRILNDGGKTINYVIPWSRVPLEKIIVYSAGQEITEGSLPCSEQPTTSPYPELDESNPYSPKLFHLNEF
jgi:hypothetical protein